MNLKNYLFPDDFKNLQESVIVVLAGYTLSGRMDEIKRNIFDPWGNYYYNKTTELFIDTTANEINSAIVRSTCAYKYIFSDPFWNEI